MKIAIDAGNAGFSLSHKAIMRYVELCGIKVYLYVEDLSKDDPNYESFMEYVPETHGKDIFGEDMSACTIYYFTEPLKNNKWDGRDYSIVFNFSEIKRNDEKLIQVIEELKTFASEEPSDIKVIEIPDDVDWVIDYVGDWDREKVVEKHREWQ